MLLAVGPLLALAALLGGCVRGEVSIRLNEDGSGTATVLMAFDSDVMKQLSGSLGGGTSGSSTELTVNDIDKSALPKGSTVEPYKDGKFSGIRITMPFKSGDDIAKLLNRVESDLSPGDTSRSSSSDSQLFEKFTLAQTAGGWNFNAVIPKPSTTSGDSSFMSKDQMKTLFKDASFAFKLKFPSNVSDSNADKKESDGTLVWKLDQFADKSRTLFASTAGDSGDGSSQIVFIIAGVVVLAVVAGGVYILMSRRRTPPTTTL